MTEAHTVKAFDQELNQVATLVVALGDRATQLANKAVDALTDIDAALAAEVIAGDVGVDALQREAEERAIGIMARRQPVAGDLRAVVGVIRLANDFERIGDLAKNIAKRVIAIKDHAQSQSLVHGVAGMGRIALEQLSEVVEAYAATDPVRALGVWRRDEEIDTLNTALFRELLTYMMEDPRNITLCAHLLFCAKNIERIGDHATNIAETIYYIASGTALPVDRKRTAAPAPAPALAGGV